MLLKKVQPLAVALFILLLSFGCTQEEELLRPESINISGVPGFSLSTGVISIVTFSGAPDSLSSATVQISSDSDIELESLESTVNYEQTDFGEWLTVSLSSNTTPLEAVLAADPEGLPPGNYTAALVLASNDLNIDTSLAINLQVETPPLSGGWALQRVCNLEGDCRDVSANDLQRFITFSDSTGLVDVGTADCDIFAWSLNGNSDELTMLVTFDGADQEYLFGIDFQSDEFQDAESAVTLTDLSFNFGRSELQVLHYLPDPMACQ